MRNDPPLGKSFPAASTQPSAPSTPHLIRAIREIRGPHSRPAIHRRETLPYTQETAPRTQETPIYTQETRSRSQEIDPRSQKIPPDSQEMTTDSRAIENYTQEIAPHSRAIENYSQEMPANTQETAPYSPETPPHNEESAPYTQEIPPSHVETPALSGTYVDRAQKYVRKCQFAQNYTSQPRPTRHVAIHQPPAPQTSDFRAYIVASDTANALSIGTNPLPALPRVHRISITAV